MSASIRSAPAVALAALALLLGGCATGPTAVVKAPAPAPSPAPAPVATPAPTVDSAAADSTNTHDGEFWQGLRARFALGGCDGDALISKWIGHYSKHPNRFQARMRNDLPLLRVAAKLAQDHDIPGEFALLPWVESNFRALPSHGNRPAGMWQIMPATGRALGLRIDSHYDGRLDTPESSASAMKLLRQHYRVLGNWGLVDMAYNTGLYRIKRLLKENPDAALDRPIPDLPVSATTRNHLAKLSALGCIVREPSRYDIQLPRVIHAYSLVRVELPQPLDLRIAARLAELPLERVRSLNAAYLDLSTPASHLTLPLPAATTLAAANTELIAWGWHGWQHVRLQQPMTLAALAGGDTAQSELLARINPTTSHASAKAASTLWLPQSMIDALPDKPESVALIASSHRVQSGDTLWDLARRFHVSVGELRLWNRLNTDLLHLGQVLRLSPP